jgi:hypothetical protein
MLQNKIPIIFHIILVNNLQPINIVMISMCSRSH